MSSISKAHNKTQSYWALTHTHSPLGVSQLFKVYTLRPLSNILRPGTERLAPNLAQFDPIMIKLTF